MGEPRVRKVSLFDRNHLMCRLYGFLANEPTKVECTLVHAQNALMAQSLSDTKGQSHAHGWGIATYEGAEPTIARKAWAAYKGEHFARTAARTFAELVLAHVRHATVGGAALNNTHPFHDGSWVFAHNGTVPGFAAMRSTLRERIAREHLSKIAGETDSEHIFRYFLTLRDRGTIDPQSDLPGALSCLAGEIGALAEAFAPGKRLGLNIIVSDGHQLAGTRVNRTLFYVHRRGVYDCEICGFPHIHHAQSVNHRAIVVASEPLSHENWTEVPNHSVWKASLDHGLSIHRMC